MKSYSWFNLIMTIIAGVLLFAYAPKLAMDIPPIGKALCYSAARVVTNSDAVMETCLERYPAETIKGALENLIAGEPGGATPASGGSMATPHNTGTEP